MVIPYGEWILLLLTLAAWAEKHPSRKQFFLLGMLWLAGKEFEGIMSLAWVWHVDYSRLAVMLAFLIWSWRRASPNIFSFAVPTVILLVEELLLANEPGTFPTENWFFAGAVFLTAWLTTQSFWGMACSVTGSVLISQLFNLFTYGGIIQYKNLPDPFLWHFSVAGLAVIALGIQMKIHWRATHPGSVSGCLENQEVLPVTEIENTESERLT